MRMRLAAGLRPDPLGKLERSRPLARSDPDAVWDGRSGGSRNEAGRPSVVWGSVNEKGNCGGECGVPHCNQWPL